MQRAVAQSAALQLVLLALVWAAVALPMLGSGGLTMTEGHRAIPGWTMLRTGDWLVPTMFEQAYMRKPPGMAWATGLSAMLLGESALSARLVSAISFGACALAAWWFGRRWFGRRGAMCAGLAMLLMPWLWTVARQAEIEALLLAGTSVGAFAVIDRLVAGGSRPRTIATLGVLGWTVAMLAKGPAALPVLVGCVGAACVVRRSWRPLVSWTHVLSQLVPGLVVAAWWLAASASVRASGQEPVLQSPGAFLFEAGRVLEIGLLAPSALLAMLPASLAMLFPWGPDARREGERTDTARARFGLARALAWAAPLALGVLVLSGISNPRYAMPTAVLMPMLVAWVCALRGEPEEAGGLLPQRAAIARAMLLGRPAVLVGVLMLGAGGFVWLGEARVRATSGAGAGAELGSALADRVDASADVLELWADDVIEARPEVLDALVRAAEDRGIRVRARWMPGADAADWMTSASGPGAVLLRGDEASPEMGVAVKMVNEPTWIDVGSAGAHKYLFRLLLRAGGGDAAPPPGG
ncbi:MAG: glycosyltransferase family 39 protein [Planctomycetota bacterium]